LAIGALGGHYHGTATTLKAMVMTASDTMPKVLPLDNTTNLR
jgi:hypothetical protein